jgi:DNA adenine methylase
LNNRPRDHRPLIRWHGGKWKIALWVVAHLPPHELYTEVFGGGAAVLIRKNRATRGELYNDLDGTLVHLMRVLQDPVKAAALVRKIALTPFSREEFYAAYGETDDDVERARRTLIRSFMGFGASGATSDSLTGFRGGVRTKGGIPAQEWASYPQALQRIIARLDGVMVENQCAFGLLRSVDEPGVLHYLDPPYHPATRSKGNRQRGAGYHVYRHELDENQHDELLDVARSLKGMVVLSGYPHDSYDEALRGWRRVTRETQADGARPRTEVLWINPAAARRLGEDKLL